MIRPDTRAVWRTATTPSSEFEGIVFHGYAAAGEPIGVSRRRFVAVVQAAKRRGVTRGTWHGNHWDFTLQDIRDLRQAILRPRPRQPSSLSTLHSSPGAGGAHP